MSCRHATRHVPGVDIAPAGAIAARAGAAQCWLPGGNPVRRAVRPGHGTTARAEAPDSGLGVQTCPFPVPSTRFRRRGIGQVPTGTSVSGPADAARRSPNRFIPGSTPLDASSTGPGLGVPARPTNRLPRTDVRLLVKRPLGDPDAMARRWPWGGALALPASGGTCGGRTDDAGSTWRQPAAACRLRPSRIALVLAFAVAYGAATHRRQRRRRAAGAKLPGHQGLVPPGATLVGPAPSSTPFLSPSRSSRGTPPRWRLRCRRSPIRVPRSITTS